MSFWSGKRVLITGGAGFLGSHLVEALVARDANVLILDDYSRGSFVIQNRIRGDASNVQDCMVCMAAFKQFRLDIVFNLAASVAGVLYNQSHHFEMFERNIRLQTAPVIAAKETGVSHFLQVSSVCVYAPQYASGAVEDDGSLGEPVGANAGYSWSKRLGERAAKWAGLPHCVIVRPSNMYGPRDYFDDRAHVIPALIRKCLEQDAIEVHGTGQEVREFLYVQDAAEGLIAAMEHGKPSTVYNIGTSGETAVTIADLIGMIQEATGTTHKPVRFTGGNAGDPVRWSNCERAATDLRWSHRVNLEDGLRRTVEWYTREAATA